MKAVSALILATVMVISATNSSPHGCLLDRSKDTTSCNVTEMVRMFHFSHRQNRCRGYMTCPDTVSHNVTGNVFTSRNECNKHCPATNCSLPLAPVNGYQKWSNASNNQIKLKVFCNDGFILDGPSERLCLYNGSWNGSQPLCKCQLPPVPVNGNYEEEMESDFILLRYSCNRGLSLVGPSERSCGRDGVWSGEEPKCVNPRDVTCPEPEDTQNGRKMVFGKTVGSYAAYSCTKSYVHISGSLWRTCMSNGQWSGEVPQCGKPFITYGDREVSNGKVEAMKGEKNVQIKCKMDPHFPSNAKVEWSRPSNSRSNNASWVENMTAFALQFNVVSVSDAGDYTCSITINSIVNTKIRRRIAVRVLSREKSSCSPHASIHPMYLTTMQPGRIDLVGFFRGCPKPTVQWYKDGVLLTNTSRISITDKALNNKNFTFSVLEIKFPQNSDNGVYRVEAKNTEGRLAYDINIAIPNYHSSSVSKRRRSIDGVLDTDNDVTSFCTSNNTVAFVGKALRSKGHVSFVKVKSLLPRSVKLEKPLKTDDIVKVYHSDGHERLREVGDHLFIVKKSNTDFILNRVYSSDIGPDLANLCLY